MFKSLLGNIPFYKRMQERRQSKSRTDAIQDLYLLRDSFKEAVSYEDTFNSLKRILLNDVSELQLNLIKDKTTKVSFRTKTSNSALELIDQKIYGRESVSRAVGLLFAEPNERPYMYWESNDESVLLLYSFMKGMVIKASLQYNTVDLKSLEHTQVTEDELEFIDSYLFRELCYDFIILLIFYLEESHDNAE